MAISRFYSQLSRVAVVLVLSTYFPLIRKITTANSFLQVLRTLTQRKHRLLLFILVVAMLLKPAHGAIGTTATKYNTQETAQMKIVDFFTAATQHRALGDYDSEDEAPPMPHTGPLNSLRGDKYSPPKAT
jgi:hypothetical protein